ncbi:MAG: hypothetical protein LUE20_00870 [Oscillospiraceae bacterium]|nr:hypothetical protein [Oscillospiraceae bacterium]
MITNELFSEAMGELDMKYITETLSYQPKKRQNFTRYLALAAVLCLVIAATVWAKWDDSRLGVIDSAVVIDVDDACEISLEEAIDNEVFGKYFPTYILDGYTIENNVWIYGVSSPELLDGTNAVIKAVFLSEEPDDVLTLMIIPMSLVESDNYYVNEIEEYGVIYYRTNSTNPESSYINLDCGEFVVYYSSNLDMTTIPDYEQMIYSSEYYAEIS